MKDFEFNLEAIEGLIEIAKKKDIAKLKVSYKGFSVAIDVKAPVFYSNGGGSSLPASSLGSHDKNGSVKDEDAIQQGNVITSPLVGIFYSRPSPDKPPFVKVGDKVKKGDVLFIIESMKLMNEVKSEYDGVVSQILVDSGDGVGYGQAVMVLQ